MLEYRIVKAHSYYNIEIRGYRIVGYLWWRRKEWKWYDCNHWGGVDLNGNFLCKTFKNIKQAESKIKYWKSHTYMNLHDA